MPYSAQRDLTGKHPLDVFQFFAMVDNTGSMYDGTGSQVINLNITASNAISATYEVTYEVSSSYADFADSSSFSISASYSSASFSSSYAKTSSFAETFDHRVTGSVLFGDDSNTATIYIAGSPSTGGKVSTIQATPAGLSLDTAGTTIYLNKTVEIGGSNITNTGGQFLGTASYAVSSSHSDTASYSLFSTSGSAASYAMSSSQADFSTSGSSTKYAVSSSNSQTSSFISPPFGAVSDVNNATGSAAGGSPGSFTDHAELGAFILAVSSSLQTLNTLIADLRAAGVIT